MICKKDGPTETEQTRKPDEGLPEYTRFRLSYIWVFITVSDHNVCLFIKLAT